MPPTQDIAELRDDGDIRPPVRDRLSASLGYQPDQLAELTRRQPSKRGKLNPPQPRRCDHLHHNNMINGHTPGLRDSF